MTIEERVARIIDPDAWRHIDSYSLQRKATAFEKAGQIVKLFEGEEWLRKPVGVVE